MLFEFEKNKVRYWYVPVHTVNEKDVPETLEGLGITYTKNPWINYNGTVIGHLYRFVCAGLLYQALTLFLGGGNGHVPMEVRTM